MANPSRAILPIKYFWRKCRDPSSQRSFVWDQIGPFVGAKCSSRSILSFVPRNFHNKHAKKQTWKLCPKTSSNFRKPIASKMFKARKAASSNNLIRGRTIAAGRGPHGSFHKHKKHLATHVCCKSPLWPHA